MNSKIKIALTLGLIVLGIASYGYFKAIPGPSGQLGNEPRIEINPQNYDFGEAQFGQILEYSFTITNLGGAPLEIKRVATSCACTKAKVDKETIQAGETAELLVTYDTAAMGDSAHGKGEQERIIYVKTNDPNNPQVDVTIQALVR
ncbi:MAG: DUF1573 domain-containing protein [bacterium]|nr:DUF1573 domain-containing protein [bacterium]